MASILENCTYITGTILFINVLLIIVAAIVSLILFVAAKKKDDLKRSHGVMNDTSPSPDIIYVENLSETATPFKDKRTAL